MRQHSSVLKRKWNRQFTRPIFPAGGEKCGLGMRLGRGVGQGTGIKLSKPFPHYSLLYSNSSPLPFPLSFLHPLPSLYCIFFSSLPFKFSIFSLLFSLPLLFPAPPPPPPQVTTMFSMAVSSGSLTDQTLMSSLSMLKLT